MLDDSRMMLIPQWVEFEKGELEKARQASLVALKGEKIKKRKKITKPVRVYLAVNYGDRYKGLNLAGNARFGNFSLSAGSQFTEYCQTELDYSAYERYRCPYCRPLYDFAESHTGGCV